MNKSCSGYYDAAGALPRTPPRGFQFAISNPLRFSHLSVLQLAHLICSQSPQFAPFTGRCSFRCLGTRNLYILNVLLFLNLCEMGPLPHSERFLNVFVCFTHLNTHSWMKVKGWAEQLRSGYYSAGALPIYGLLAMSNVQ